MGKGLSITAFVLSFIIPFVGLILGIIAVVKSKKDKDSLKGLAIAAIAIGGVGTIIMIILAIVIFSMMLYPPLDYGPIGSTVYGFSLSPPLIGNAIYFTEEGAEFDIGNGGSSTISITGIKIDSCSPDIFPVNDSYNISPGDFTYALYTSSNVNCLNSPDPIYLTVYFTEEGSSITKGSSGMIPIATYYD